MYQVEYILDKEASVLEEIDVDSNYFKAPIGYFRKDIKEMYENEEIYEINRE